MHPKQKTNSQSPHEYNLRSRRNPKSNYNQLGNDHNHNHNHNQRRNYHNNNQRPTYDECPSEMQSYDSILTFQWHGQKEDQPLSFQKVHLLKDLKLKDF